jgi:hypothetical protein
MRFEFARERLVRAVSRSPPHEVRQGAIAHATLQVTQKGTVVLDNASSGRSVSGASISPILDAPFSPACTSSRLSMPPRGSTSTADVCNRDKV